MKTGVSTASLFSRKYNEDALPLLEKMGIKTVEVFLTSFSEYGYPFADVLKKAKGNLQVNSVHDLTSEFEPQLLTFHPRVRKDAFDMLGKVMESAKALGSPYYSFHGATRAKIAERMDGRDNFEKLCRSFWDICEFCKGYGVTLCLENVEWSTYNRVGVFEKIAKNVPDMRGVLDIKQARLSGYPYEQYLAEMGEKIAYVHVSDVNKEGKMCLPGQGVFDFATLIKRLKDVGFDGALLIEAYAGDYGEEIELKCACDYLDEQIDKWA